MSRVMNRAINRTGICTLLCSFFFSSSITFAEPSVSSCEFAISQGTQSLRRFTLTEAVFRCMTRPDYRGLSVINGNNLKVPFEIQMASGRTQTERALQELKLYPEPDPSPYKTGDQIRRIAALTGIQSGAEMDRQWQLKNKYYSSVLIKLPPGNDQLVKLQLDLNTPEAPLSAVLLVEASDDLQHWSIALDPYHLYSLPGANDHKENDHLQNVDLPIKSMAQTHSTKSRYLRLAMLSNIPDLHLMIEKITGEFQSQKHHPVLPQWMTVELEATENPNEWLFELPGLFPISRIRFNPAEDIAYYQGNLSVLPYQDPQTKTIEERPRDEGKKKIKALLHGRKPDFDSQPSWRWISNFSQYRLNLESGTVRSSELSLNPVAAKIWKLTFNQPSIHKAEMLPSVEVGWIPPQITFLTQGPGPYRLLTGEQKNQPLPIPRSIYRPGDAAELVGLVDEDIAYQNSSQQPHEATTGTSTESDFDWKKALLWLVLCLGFIVMAVIALRLGRAMNSDTNG